MFTTVMSEQERSGEKMKIITSSGKEWQIKWCGVSAFDNVLRFEIVNSTMQDVLLTFTDESETETLRYYFDAEETVYTGYSVFKGVDLRHDGGIVVSLNHE